MVFSLSILCATLTLLTGSATAAPQTADWKYARGWDGVVSAATAIGEPIVNITTSLATREASTVGGIYLCVDANFSGVCGFAVEPLRECIVLGTDWNKKISSIGPDLGTVVVAYAANDCTGVSTTFVYPGTGDLVSIGWNDVISSFFAYSQ